MSYYLCSFCHIGIVCCIQSIIYCMDEQLELYSPLLLLLIVIYDGVGTYNETIIMDWCIDDDDDVGLCERICLICYHDHAHPFPQR